jgi:hypothetical protein
MVRLIFFITFTVLSISLHAQKNKGKNKKEKNVVTEYVQIGEDPLPDTATKFTGIIKYRITTDDPADRDSMFIIFGNEQVRVIMFSLGIRVGDTVRDNYIARFNDSAFLTLDERTRTYKRQKISDANPGTEFSLFNHKKIAQVLKFNCQEYSGEMTLKDGETFQAACLVSKQHSFIKTRDYYFMNIQPVVMGYKIVLGYRTKSSDNESTYIVAYKIEPGNVENYFDLNNYQQK